MKWLVALNVVALALVGWFAREHVALCDRVSELESGQQHRDRAHAVGERVVGMPRVVPRPHLTPSPTPSPPSPSVDERLARLEEQVREPQDAPAVDTRAETAAADGPVPVPAALTRAQVDDVADHFALYDYDGSGTLSPDELSMTRAEVTRFDLNSDGELGHDEVSRLGELARVAGRAAENITGGGFPIRRSAMPDQQRFSFLDADGDGLVSEDEYIAALADAVRQVRRFDLDRNGGLTHAELWDAPTRFARLDLDGDALVYAWEVLDSQSHGRW